MIFKLLSFLFYALLLILLLLNAPENPTTTEQMLFVVIIGIYILISHNFLEDSKYGT